jgi:hypothetical protein
MWWLMIPIYVIGWMGTFRVAWLRITDSRLRWATDIMREAKEKENRRGAGDWRYFVGSAVREARSAIRDKRFTDQWKIIGLSFSWPGVLIYLIARFIMFPRGAKTRWDREQEASERARKAEAELEEARAMLKKEGIIV